MKPTKISDERRQRMFPPDREYGITRHREAAPVFAVKGSCAPRWVLGQQGGQSAERPATPAAFRRLTKSADQHTQEWRKAIRQAIDELVETAFGVAKRQINAIIGGRSTSFKSAEDKFNALVMECRRLQEPGSSTALLANDAYGQIVAMGWNAVPLILREMRQNGGHWISALTWITGIDLVSPEMYGNNREMRKVWIRWGIEHGYLSSGDSEGKVVSGQPAQRERK